MIKKPIQFRTYCGLTCRVIDWAVTPFTILLETPSGSRFVAMYHQTEPATFEGRK